jgi:predicted secreted protein
MLVFSASRSTGVILCFIFITFDYREICQIHISHIYKNINIYIIWWLSLFHHQPTRCICSCSTHRVAQASYYVLFLSLLVIEKYAKYTFPIYIYIYKKISNEPPGFKRAPRFGVYIYDIYDIYDICNKMHMLVFSASRSTGVILCFIFITFDYREICQIHVSHIFIYIKIYIIWWLSLFHYQPTRCICSCSAHRVAQASYYVSFLSLLVIEKYAKYTFPIYLYIYISYDGCLSFIINQQDAYARVQRIA